MIPWAAALCAATSIASADLILSDAMDYVTTGVSLGDALDSFTANGGTGWSNAYQGGNGITLVAGLDYPGPVPGVDASGQAIASTDNVNQRNFDGTGIAELGESTWFSVLVTSTGYSGNQRLLFFSPGSSSRGFGVQFESGGNVTPRIANNNGTSSTATFSSTGANLLVGKFTWGSTDGTTTVAHQLDLWMNPPDIASEAGLGTIAATHTRNAIADGGNGAGTINIGSTTGVYFRGQGSPAIVYDEIRLGDDLTDVLVPSGPVFTSDDSVIVPSGTSGADFFSVTGFDPLAGNLTFSITGGADAADFAVSSNGVLSYTANAGTFDFGTPTDSDTDNIYELEVTATADSAGMLSNTQSLTIQVIDNSPPTVTAANIDVTGNTGTGGAFRIGDTVTASWDSTADGEFSTTAVTFDFSEFEGPAAVAATNFSGVWTATYTITAGSSDVTDANVSVTATNVNGSTTVADDTNFVFDNVAPVVTDPNIAIITAGSGGGGEFINGDPITAEWTDAGGDNNPDTAAASFDFTEFGGPAAEPGAESSGVYTATYTVDFQSVNGSNLNASVTVTDDAGNSTTTADTSNLTIVTAMVEVSAVTGSVDEDNLATTASYTVNLSTAPSGAVEVSATSDGQTELSLNGSDWFTTLAISFSDTSIQTVTIRAIDDAVAEGPHSSDIDHAITTTADALNFPPGLPVPGVSVDVADNDFDIAVATGSGTIANTSPTSLAGVTVPAVTDGLLVVTIGAEGGGGAGPDTVEFDGQELTREVQIATNGVSHASIWYLVNPPATTAAIEVTWASNPFAATAQLAWYVLEDINQTDPVVKSDISESGSGSTGESVTLTDLDPDSVLIDALITNDNQVPDLVFGPDQVAVHTSANIGGGASFGTSIEAERRTGTQTQTASWISATRAGYGVVAFRDASVIVSTPFETWAASNITAIDAGADATFDGNPDNDPFANGLEWLLGGDPLNSDATEDLLQFTTEDLGNGEGLTITFTREETAKSTTTTEVEASSDLFVFDIIPIDIDAVTPPFGVVVDITENGAAPDDVSVFIPGPAFFEIDGKLFGRIKVNEN